MATNRKKLNADFGDPFLDAKTFELKNMKVLRVNKLFPSLPFSKVYINKALESPLINTFTLLDAKGLLHEIKKYDGCFMVRCIRGYENPCIGSIHAWAMAIDFNASDNPLGMSREQCIKKGLTPFTEAFLDVWRQTGWVCGADFGRKDGMHFQWTRGYEV